MKRAAIIIFVNLCAFCAGVFAAVAAFKVVLPMTSMAGTVAAVIAALGILAVWSWRGSEE